LYAALPLSLLLHAGLLGWALISFRATPPLKIPEVEPVEVAIISPDELIRLRQGDRSSKKLETKAAKPNEKTEKIKEQAKKQPQRAVQPPPPSAPPPVENVQVEKAPDKPKSDEIAKKLAALQPLPEPKPDELALKAAAERKAAEAKKRAQEKKKAEAKKKADELKRQRLEKERKRKLAEKRRRAREEKKKQFDPDKLAALLNKIPDKAAPPSGSEPQPQDKKLPEGPRAGAPEGKDQRLTASQRSLLGVMMKRAVRECWRVQTGMSGADRLVVEVEVKLRPTGELDGEPRVRNRGSDPGFRDAALNAVRALKQCEPYDLPKDLYKGGWDHMVVTFDPQRMF
jgi:colicin import membrane protein